MPPLIRRALVGALVVLGAVSGPSAGAEAAPVTCEGVVATIVATANRQQLTGTEGDDVISANRFRGVSVAGLGGDDLICGGRWTSDGTAVLSGGAGNDSIVDEGGGVRIKGNSGDDILVGGGGDVRINGNSGDDLLMGSGVQFFPGKGTNTIQGAPGALDVLSVARREGVTIDVQSGTATLRTPGGDVHDTFTDIDGFLGSIGDDVLRGSAHIDYFWGRGGHDDVSVGRGEDYVVVEGGLIRTGGGNDQVITYGPGTVTTGDGRDSISAGIDCQGNVHQYRCHDDPARRMSLSAGAGDDQLYLDGNVAHSTLGRVRGTVDGGPGADTLGFGYTDADLTIDLAAGWMSWAFFAGHLTSIEALTGGAGDDLLYGTGRPDTISGGDGNDHVFGGPGADVLEGDHGQDTADGGRGADSCLAETSHGCESRQRTDRRHRT